MLHETDWFVYADEPDVRVLVRLEKGAGDSMVARVKRQWKNPAAYLKAAAEDRLANAGRRWGEGQVIGRMPLPVYFSTGMAEARKQGDEKYIRKTWSDSDYKYLRTFEGKL